MTQTQEQEDCPLCFDDFQIAELDRTLVAAFMCGISAVLHGSPAIMVEVLCTVHQPLVIDAMGFLAEQNASVVDVRHGSEVPRRPTPAQADFARMAAAQAKRDRKARR